MKKIEEIKKIVEENKNSKKEIEVFFMNKEANREIRIYKESFGADILNELQNQYLKKFKGLLKKIVEVIEYTPDSNVEKNILLKLKKEKVNKCIKLEKEMDNTPQMERLRTLDKYDDLLGIIVVLKIENKKIIILKKYTNKKNLKEKREKIFGIGKIVQGELLEIKEKLLTLEIGIDCFYLEDELFISGKSNFEDLFLYHDEIEKEANKKLDEIKKLNYLEEFEKFEKWSKSNPKLINKKLSILEINKELDFKKLKEAASDGKLRIYVDSENKKIKTKSDNVKENWDILKLLAEHILHSKITGHIYDAPTKRRV